MALAHESQKLHLILVTFEMCTQDYTAQGSKLAYRIKSSLAQPHPIIWGKTPW